jgi:hypothetical protein
LRVQGFKWEKAARMWEATLISPALEERGFIGSTSAAAAAIAEIDKLKMRTSIHPDSEGVYTIVRRYFKPGADTACRCQAGN